jgi:hypothetical protein
VYHTPRALRSLGIVLTQEGFVKMDDGIFHFGGLAIVFEYLLYVAGQKYICTRLIYNPFDTVVYTSGPAM